MIVLCETKLWLWSTFTDPISHAPQICITVTKSSLVEATFCKKFHILFYSSLSAFICCEVFTPASTYLVIEYAHIHPEMVTSVIQGSHDAASKYDHLLHKKLFIWERTAWTLLGLITQHKQGNLQVSTIIFSVGEPWNPGSIVTAPCKFLHCMLNFHLVPLAQGAKPWLQQD